MLKTVLAINPGSTSTKFAVYRGEECLLNETIRYHDDELLKFKNVTDQLQLRLDTLLDYLKIDGFNFASLDGVVGRGGLLAPMESGTYAINEKMVADALNAQYGEHASNLGPILAGKIADLYGIPAFIVDPVGVDEFIEEARISGMAGVERISQSHALNIKAVSRKIARQLGKPLSELNFVVAHLGSGISVAAHRTGRIVDVNNANNEGPFSPERTGTLPAKQLVKLCYSGQFSEKEMHAKITQTGGVYSYLGTKNMVEVEQRMLAGNETAALVLNAMIHQLGKEIGAMSSVLEGSIDGIILTGGLAHSDILIEKLTPKIRFLGEIFVVPGEEELEALAAGAIRVLNLEESAKEY